MAGGVGVLGPEGGSEGVDFSECRSAQLALELSAHGKRRPAAEEVFAVVNFSLFVFRQGSVEVEGRHLEHIAGSFRIRGGDERGVEVHEALGVEVLVDCEGHLAAQAEHRTEGVGAGAHMCHRPEVLERSVFLLQGIAHRVAFAIDGYLRGADFHGLAAAHGFDQIAPDAYTGAGTDLCEHRFHLRILVHHYLYVLDGGAVVEGDECYFFVASLSPYPTFGKDLFACLHIQQVLHFCANNFHFMSIP